MPHHHRAEVRLPGGPPTYFDLDGSGSGLRILFDAAGELTFHFLPEELSEDLGFLRETGLANCYSAGRHLAALGTEAGLARRPAFGLFVSPPFSNRHAWIEIAVDGRRLPTDPFFVRTLTEWGLLDPQAWPPHRAPSARSGATPPPRHS